MPISSLNIYLKRERSENGEYSYRNGERKQAIQSQQSGNHSTEQPNRGEGHVRTKENRRQRTVKRKAELA